MFNHDGGRFSSGNPSSLHAVAKDDATRLSCNHQKSFAQRADISSPTISMRERRIADPVRINHIYATGSFVARADDARCQCPCPRLFVHIPHDNNQVTIVIFPFQRSHHHHLFSFHMPLSKSRNTDLTGRPIPPGHDGINKMSCTCAAAGQQRTSAHIHSR